jgi:biotin carboxyl carrier protein
MELTQADVINILKMIDEAPMGHFSLELGELKLEVAKGEPGAAQPLTPTQAPAAAALSDVTAAAGNEDGMVPIKAPVLGMFYRRPEPTQPPYVEEGSQVDEDTTVALIEVMKMFTPVKAGIKGTVRRICVENGSLIEFEQDLFMIEPSS